MTIENKPANSALNLSETLKKDYTDYYNWRDKEGQLLKPDSSKYSRCEIIDTIIDYLDNNKMPLKFLTLDFADILAENLHVSSAQGIQKSDNGTYPNSPEKERAAIEFFHLQADGCILPIKSNSVSLIVSNEAFDLMIDHSKGISDPAVQEVHRILIAKGKAVMNFHHLSLIEFAESMREIDKRQARELPQFFDSAWLQAELERWSKVIQLKEKIFPSEDAIHKAFEPLFQIEEIDLRDDSKFGSLLST
jgi:hypothetical protein